jgi:PhnB protein
MRVQPYLVFDGRCEEALDFYKKATGAEIDRLMRWKDNPDKSMCTPSNADKIMHSQFRIGETEILASDGRNTGHPEFKGFALTVSTKDAAELDKLVASLGEGGTVTVPPAKTFFAERFGVLTDKFGVNWMLIVAR